MCFMSGFYYTMLISRSCVYSKIIIQCIHEEKNTEQFHRTRIGYRFRELALTFVCLQAGSHKGAGFLFFKNFGT